MSVVVVFHVALKQQYEAFVRLIANIVKLVAVIALVAAQAGLVLLVAATTCNVFVAVALAWIIVAGVSGSGRSGRSPARFRSCGRRSRSARR